LVIEKSPATLSACLQISAKRCINIKRCRSPRRHRQRAWIPVKSAFPSSKNPQATFCNRFGPPVSIAALQPRVDRKITCFW